MTYISAILLGLLQGVTELFPVSSLGHTVILPALFRLHIDQTDPFFVVFIVATHAATAVVLLGFFWREWIEIGKGVLRSIYLRRMDPRDPEARLGWMLIVATLPAGLLGLLFEHKLTTLFANPLYAAFFLIGNGILLLGVEVVLVNTKPVAPSTISLSWSKTLLVGCMQCLALLPGFSRTGATLAGGLIVGLSHTDAARFSFLLATPIIAAAALLKLPKVIAGGVVSGQTGPLVIGVIVAAAAAYCAVRYLSQYFKNATLRPFAYYCIGMGIVSIIGIM